MEGRKPQLEDLFGEVIHSYTDQDAVDDGILVRLLNDGRDTGYRMTRTAYATLFDHHRGRRDKDEAKLCTQFFVQVLGFTFPARYEYLRGGVFKTDYDFNPTRNDREVLWYLPNEVGGITVMLPEDY